MKISKYVENARYSDALETVINDLKPLHLKWLDYESNWQGYVEIDVLLENGQVFSYEYTYGSCSGCDEWESRGLSDYEIQEEMIKGAVIYSSMETYMKGIGSKRQDKATTLWNNMRPDYFSLSESKKLADLRSWNIKEAIFVSWVDPEFYDKYRILFDHNNMEN
jgi:hypothetical protein